MTAVRTTVRLNEDLLREAKRAAAESGRTLTAFMEDALRQALARRATQEQAEHRPLPTVPGWGLRPGVDLDDSAALLDLLEEGDAPPRRAS